MRKSRDLPNLFIVVAVVIGFALSAGLGAAERFDRHVPPDITQYVMVQSYERLMKTLEASPYGGLMDEQEVQKFIDQIKNKISGDLSKFEKVTGMKPQALENFFHGRVAFAMQQKMAQAGGEVPQMSVLLLSELGPKEQKAAALLQGLKAKAKTDPRFSVSEEKIAGHTVSHFITQDVFDGGGNKMEEVRPTVENGGEGKKEGEKMHYMVSIENGILAVSTGQKGAMMKAYFERRDGADATSLADSKLYQDLLKRVDSKSIYLAFQNYNVMWDNMKRQMQNMPTNVNPGDIMDEVGLTALKGQIGAVRFTKSGLASTAFLGVKKEHKGIVKALVPQQEVDVTPPSFVASDAALYLGCHFSMNVFWDEAMRIMQKFSPETYQMIRMQMDNPQAPFNVEKGLIRALGDRWFVYVPEKVIGGEETEYINALVAVDLEKPDALRGMLGNVMAMPQMQGKLLTEDVEGTTMYKTPPAPVFSRLTGETGPPVHVCLAIVEDRLFIGMSPQATRRAINGIDRMQLKDAKQYRTNMQHVQKQGNSLLYLDQRVAGRWLVSVLGGVLEKEGLDLPSYQTLKKYLSVSTSTSKWIEDGLMMKSWMEYPRGK